jgi:5-methylcytosine-specific restriction protein B
LDIATHGDRPVHLADVIDRALGRPPIDVGVPELGHRILEHQSVVEELIRTQVRRLQLHPAYSYEDFIRGLRLEEGNTVARDGDLLELIKEVQRAEDDPPAGLEPLPWVLILDEINRADLSRLFGEAFSVLEDRDAGVRLPIQGPGLEPEITMPEDVFLIGTMNLIDQSVEQLDFALRRRFLWLPRGFERDVIPEVVELLWRDTDVEQFPWIKRYPWGEALDHARRR